MPQHVRVRLESQLRLRARALAHAGEACGAERCAALAAAELMAEACPLRQRAAPFAAATCYDC
jgi:hypothetical protein